MAKRRFAVQVYVNGKDETRVGIQMSVEDARALAQADDEAQEALSAAIAEVVS